MSKVSHPVSLRYIPYDTAQWLDKEYAEQLLFSHVNWHWGFTDGATFLYVQPHVASCFSLHNIH